MTMHRPYSVPVRVDIESPKSVLAHINIKVDNSEEMCLISFYLLCNQTMTSDM